MATTKKKTVKTVTKEKTLVEQCYEFAKTLNPTSRFSEMKSGDQELTFYPMNGQADKIVITTLKIGDKKRIDGSRLLKSEKFPFLMIETNNTSVMQAAEKICIAVLKGN